MVKKDSGITIKKQDDMAEWYSQVVLKAELADYAPVKGFMTIRPRGYAIWEEITNYFNLRIKRLGVKNAYFPLLIPESFFRKEAEHAAGFAPELAWIEKLDMEEERVAIRPTSETIMYHSYANWIRSWRDLPLKINQWCNVLRWEVKQCKIFLRTREFLWQEGHCVYETEKQMDTETKLFWKEYANLCEKLLAIPVLTGVKTKSETFAGAEKTYTVEALMPDGKALQMSTAHNLGQNFAKAFNIEYLGKDEKKNLAWQNSWGFSTRLIGAVIMVHGDDKGFVLPPKIATEKIVIIPIYKDKDKTKVLKKASELKIQLSDFDPILDDRDGYSAGWKYNEWELKGIPLRLEIGPRDMEKCQVVIVRRDTGEKDFIKFKDIEKSIPDLLDKMQNEMYVKAKKLLTKNTISAKNLKEFDNAINNKKIVKASHCSNRKCEDELCQNGVSPRCISNDKPTKCIKCGKKAEYVLYFGKNY